MSWLKVLPPGPKVEEQKTQRRYKEHGRAAVWEKSRRWRRDSDRQTDRRAGRCGGGAEKNGHGRCCWRTRASVCGLLFDSSLRWGLIQSWGGKTKVTTEARRTRLTLFSVVLLKANSTFFFPHHVSSVSYTFLKKSVCKWGLNGPLIWFRTKSCSFSPPALLMSPQGSLKFHQIHSLLRIHSHKSVRNCPLSDVNPGTL